MKNYKLNRLLSLFKSIIINFLIILAFAGFFSDALYVTNTIYAFYGALLITLFYRFIRPALMLISIVPILITFGFFIVIINALIILLVSKILSPDFSISSFGASIGLAIFISVLNSLINGEKNLIIKRYK